MESSQRPTLAERVDGLVRWLFDGYITTPPKGAKVFNDALLGNLLFSRHEVAVIDSPILQRLRRIKQTGLVYYVFRRRRTVDSSIRWVPQPYPNGVLMLFKNELLLRVLSCQS